MVAEPVHSAGGGLAVNETAGEVANKTEGGAANKTEGLAAEEKGEGEGR